MGPCDVLRQNPHNAVSLLGHTQGVVTMWTPNMSSPVIKMLTHKVSFLPPAAATHNSNLSACCQNATECSVLAAFCTLHWELDLHSGQGQARQNLC